MHYATHCTTRAVSSTMITVPRVGHACELSWMYSMATGHSLRQHTLLPFSSHSSKHIGCHPKTRTLTGRARLDSVLQHPDFPPSFLPEIRGGMCPVVLFHGCSTSLIKPTHARRQRRECLPGYANAGWGVEVRDKETWTTTVGPSKSCAQQLNTSHSIQLGKW